MQIHGVWAQTSISYDMVRKIVYSVRQKSKWSVLDKIMFSMAGFKVNRPDLRQCSPVQRQQVFECGKIS